MGLQTDKYSYEGQEFNDKSSIGRIVNKDKIIEGELRKGSSYGYVRIIYNNQDYYEGVMTDNQYNGNGILYMKNGTVVAGVWKSNKLYKTQEEDKIDNINNIFANAISYKGLS